MNGSPIISISPHDSPDVLPCSGRMPSSSRIILLVGLILIAGQVFWVYRQYPRDAIATPDYVGLGEVDEDVELMSEIAIRNTSDQTIRCIGIPRGDHHKKCTTAESNNSDSSRGRSGQADDREEGYLWRPNPERFLPVAWDVIAETCPQRMLQTSRNHVLSSCIVKTLKHQMA